MGCASSGKTGDPKAKEFNAAFSPAPTLANNSPTKAPAASGAACGAKHDSDTVRGQLEDLRAELRGKIWQAEEQQRLSKLLEERLMAAIRDKECAIQSREAQLEEANARLSTERARHAVELEEIQVSTEKSAVQRCRREIDDLVHAKRAVDDNLFQAMEENERLHKELRDRNARHSSELDAARAAVAEQVERETADVVQAKRATEETLKRVSEELEGEIARLRRRVDASLVGTSLPSPPQPAAPHSEPLRIHRKKTKRVTETRLQAGFGGA